MYYFKSHFGIQEKVILNNKLIEDMFFYKIKHVNDARVLGEVSDEPGIDKTAVVELAIPAFGIDQWQRK